MPQAIHISPIDNVVVALHPIAKGTLVEVDGLAVTALEDIPQGHKMAVKPIKNGENVIKYGFPIGHATADGLICKRPAGNTYKIQDDAWALDFYYAHKDDTAAQLVKAVLTNTQMWDQDLTKIEGLEAAVLADLELIRTEGAEAAYKSCL